MRDWATGLPKGELGAFLTALSPNALVSLPWLFEHWALGHQLPPEGDWTTWVILGGRGAGKTRAGAEWVRAQVEGAKPGDPGACSRVALIGDTLDEAREVMVFGPSGILACSPPDRRPKWQATRRRLIWPNGAVAQVFSASDPESLRGPQFDAAWCDELAKWDKAEAAWAQLMLALRLGKRPRAVVTTTPRAGPVLRAILDAPGTVRTGAPTGANAANLAAGFLEAVAGWFGDTSRFRQEIGGELIEDVDGALWTWAMLDAAKAPRPALALDRVVVAVDPPVSSGAGADTCGIVVAGVAMAGAPHEWVAEVLFDGSVQGLSPRGWAERAVALYHAHGADRLVVEVNQGGELVAELIRGVEGVVPVRPVRARQAKGVRAEPVAALYEQGRVRHRAGFPELEAEMTRMTVGGLLAGGRKSPDRVDALVWAITELMIEGAKKANPRVRGLG